MISKNNIEIDKSMPRANIRRALENSLKETENTLLSGVCTQGGLGSSHTDFNLYISPDSYIFRILKQFWSLFNC